MLGIIATFLYFQELAEDFLNDYTFLNIGSIELSANKNITQEIVFCDQFAKLNTFLDKVESLDSNKMLVFAETKKSVDFLERALRKRYYVHYFKFSIRHILIPFNT